MPTKAEKAEKAEPAPESTVSKVTADGPALSTVTVAGNSYEFDGHRIDPRFRLYMQQGKYESALAHLFGDAVFEQFLTDATNPDGSVSWTLYGQLNEALSKELGAGN